MLETLAPAGLRAVLMGPVAARALHEGGRGTVRAVFDRSSYVSLDDRWVCIGSVALGAGALNLVCAPWRAGCSMSSVLQVGDAARVERGALHAGPITIPLVTAQPWRPVPADAWSKASLGRGLVALDDALPAILPAEGLARLLRPSGARHQVTPVLAAAQPPARYLTLLFDASTAGQERTIDAEQIVPLIGLGPGLTPSGDDYLGGVLIALALTGRAALRDRVWHALEPHLAGRTSDISRAHLAAAAEGFGNAVLHDLLAAMLGGRSEAIPSALAAVAAIGHTSGWDALAGAIAVLRAL